MKQITFLSILMFMLFYFANLAHAQCPAGDIRELWYVKTENPGTHRVYKYDMNTNTETIYTIINKPATLTNAEIFTDIGFAPNGDLYVVSFAATGSLWKVTIPTSGTNATISRLVQYSNYLSNSLSFDLRGQLYVGATGNSELRRSSASPYTTGYTVWHSFPAGTSAAGDFIFKDGYLYILWAGTNGQTRLYRAVVNANNDYVSHVDLGNVSTLIGGSYLGYGMARIGNDLYVGGSNSTLYKVTSFSPLAVAAVPASGFTTAGGGQIYGLTGRYESFGDFVNPPAFPQATYALPVGKTTVDLATIQPNPAAPSGVTVAWFNDASLTNPVTNPSAAPTGVYYAAFRRTEDSYIPNGCFSPSVRITESANLPVTFNFVSAEITSNTLSVNWSTLSEVNNDYFEVEVSKDGKDFVSIAKVESKAKESNINNTLYYNVTRENSLNSGLVGLSLFFIVVAASLFKVKTRKMNVVIAILSVGTIIGSCSNKSIDSISNTTEELFVRVKQVDKDGRFEFSKTVKAIKK